MYFLSSHIPYINYMRAELMKFKAKYLFKPNLAEKHYK